MAPQTGPPLPSLPGITLTIATEPTLPALHVCEPTVVFVAQGRHSFSLGDRTLDCGSGQYLVVSVDLPVKLHIAEASPERPYLSVIYSLKPEKIVTLLLETERELDDGTAPPGIAISDMAEELTDAVGRLVKLLD